MPLSFIFIFCGQDLRNIKGTKGRERKRDKLRIRRYSLYNFE